MKQQLFKTMGKGLYLIPLLFWMSMVQIAAQTVSGKVYDSSSSETLIGVSIKEVGTNNGTVSDVNGNYSIRVSKIPTKLTFSYVGYESQTVDATGAKLDLSMGSSATLNEVVVTALGISREKKSLTYGAQEISSSELTRVKDANVINSLSGRTAGLQINRSGSGVGGSTRVVMRGQKSTRDNNVLYVVDGVPMFNPSIGQPGDVWGQSEGSGNVGRDGGDAIANINPEDIESMTVLKGASAAALYGSQAANGVILITTKKGKDGAAKIDFSTNMTFETPNLLPELQYSYGQTAAGASDSWGSKVSASDHVTDFYQTGATYINSIGLTGGNKIAQTYFSYSNTNSKGIIPTSKLNRHNVTLRETADFMDNRLNLSATFNYVNQTGENRSASGLYFNPLTGLYLFPRGLNFSDYSGEKYKKFDDSRKLDVQNWVGSRDDWQNPYWILNRNPNFDNRNRYIGTVSVGYKLSSWAKITLRGNMDKTFDRFEQHSFAGTEATLADPNGRLVMSSNENTSRYGDAILNLNKNFDKISFSANIGSSITDVKRVLDYYDSKGPGLRYANVFILQNMMPSSNITRSQPTRSQLQAVFGNVSLGYKNMLYLDATARNDWSSTLSYTDNVSFFYPSVGATAILSEMMDMGPLDFAKIRASYAEVGNAVNPYDTYILHPYPAGGAGPISVGYLPGKTPKPELSKSIEVGADVRFWQNRAGIDLTWYKTNTINQRIVVGAPLGSGLSNFIVNAGDVQNSGIEATLSLTPVTGKDFQWNTNLNYTRNRNKVLELTDLLSDGVFTLTDGGVNNYDMVLREGHPFGEIGGKGFKRMNGSIVVTADGVPVAGADTVLGNPAPDFTLGWNNTINYKNFTFGVLIDGRFGGEVMSITQAVTDRFGVSKVTEDARNNGGVDVPAVYEDGTRFNGKLDAGKYYRAVGGRDGITEAYIYNGTSVRLRELSIGYKFPKSVTDKLGTTSGLKLSFVGRNLFFFKNDAPFDPDISMSTGTGLQGVDVFSQPSVRSYGLNLSLTF